MVKIMTQYEVLFCAREKAELISEEREFILEKDNVLVKTEYDLISAGTELANYLGLPNTAADSGWPIHMGYSASGCVIGTGPEVKKSWDCFLTGVISDNERVRVA